MQVTDADFEQLVLNSDGPVLVDFWASWCPPCKAMEPLVQRLRNEFAGRVAIVGLNIDRNPQTATRYRINSVPAFLLFEGGREVAKKCGALTERQLRELIGRVQKPGATGVSPVRSSELGRHWRDESVAHGNKTLSQQEPSLTSALPLAPNWIAVVSGLPRSGTSMMMHMLDAGGIRAFSDGLRAADEDNPQGYFELEAVKKLGDDASWLAEAQGRGVKVIYKLLPALPPDFPYRVVFMRRDMQEVLASQRAMLARSGRSADASNDAQLAALFENELQTTLQWLSAQPNVKLLEVNYNEMVKDCQPQLARLNEFFDRGLNLPSMAAVLDQRLYRQRVA